MYIFYHIDCYIYDDDDGELYHYHLHYSSCFLKKMNFQMLKSPILYIVLLRKYLRHTINLKWIVVVTLVVTLVVVCVDVVRGSQVALIVNAFIILATLNIIFRVFC